MGVCGLGLSAQIRPGPLKATAKEERESRVPQLRIQTSALYQKRRSHSGQATPAKTQCSRKTSEAETRQRAGSFGGGKDFHWGLKAEANK